MWATARPKREGRKMRERPEPACSVPDLAHLQQAFLRREVAREPLFSVAQHGFEDFANYKVWGQIYENPTIGPGGTER